MKRSTFLMTMLATAMGTLTLGVEARGDEMDDLKEKFKQRYNALQQAKSAGKVGETAVGYVDTVKPEYRNDRAIAQLVDSENADRRRLYQLIAEKTGTKPEVVAAQNAARNFQRARSGEYLKGKDGRWYRKQ